ncbi:MAG: hypothetical protein U1F43_01550 [Myxococcota bacterium]
MVALELEQQRGDLLVRAGRDLHQLGLGGRVLLGERLVGLLAQARAGQLAGRLGLAELGQGALEGGVGRAQVAEVEQALRAGQALELDDLERVGGAPSL